jgi:hypothetical protein
MWELPAAALIILNLISTASKYQSIVLPWNCVPTSSSRYSKRLVMDAQHLPARQRVPYSSSASSSWSVALRGKVKFCPIAMHLPWRCGKDFPRYYQVLRARGLNGTPPRFLLTAKLSPLPSATATDIRPKMLLVLQSAATSEVLVLHFKL